MNRIAEYAWGLVPLIAILVLPIGLSVLRQVKRPDYVKRLKGSSSDDATSAEDDKKKALSHCG